MFASSSEASAVLVKEVDASSCEGESDAKTADLPESKYQLLAKMSKTAATVAVNTIDNHQLFKNIMLKGTLSHQKLLIMFLLLTKRTSL